MTQTNRMKSLTEEGTGVRGQKDEYWNMDVHHTQSHRSNSKADGTLRQKGLLQKQKASPGRKRRVVYKPTTQIPGTPLHYQHCPFFFFKASLFQQGILKSGTQPKNYLRAWLGIWGWVGEGIWKSTPVYPKELEVNATRM